MSPELDAKLVAKYPGLYKDRNGDPLATAMCWGFECDDGWYDILDRLSARLVQIDERIVATQVKEKFGTLRFYITWGCDEAWAAIDSAELETETTCEVCGKTGKLRPGGWIKVLCDEHHAERQSKNG